MIPRLLSIAAVSLVLVGGAPLTYAAEDNPALVRDIQGMLIKRGYLKDYHKEWDQCSQRADLDPVSAAENDFELEPVVDLPPQLPPSPWRQAVARELERLWPNKSGMELVAQCIHYLPEPPSRELLEAFLRAAVRVSDEGEAA